MVIKKGAGFIVFLLQILIIVTIIVWMSDVSDRNDNSEYFEHVESLLNNGHDASKLLNSAVGRRNIQVIALLLDQNLEGDVLSKALFEAVMTYGKSRYRSVNRNINSDVIIDLLVGKGADITFHNRHGFMPLHYAIRYNDMDAVKAFVKHGADIHVLDKNGKAPIHYAAEWRKYEDSHYSDLEPDAFRTLLKYNPNLYLKNKDGLSVFDIAENGKQKEVLDLLPPRTSE